MTLIGLSQDLAMLWLWIGSLFSVGMHQPPVHRTAPQVVIAKAADPSDGVVRRFTYLFEGLAANEKGVCPHASVMVRLTSPHGVQLQSAAADEDGRYALELTIAAASHEPVDWSIEAYTPDGRQVEMRGRRIVMKDDEIITVHDGRDSAPSPTRKPAIRYIPSKSYEEVAVG